MRTSMAVNLRDVDDDSLGNDMIAVILSSPSTPTTRQSWSDAAVRCPARHRTERTA